MGLPFRSNYDAIKQITIKDGYGGEIDVPSRGFASIKEYNEVLGLLVGSNDSSGKPDFDRLKTLEQDIVVTMLRHRFNDFKTSKDELLKLESGEDIGAPMLKSLYNFFSKELGLDSLNLPAGEYKLPSEQTKLIPVETEEKSSRNSRQKGLVNASS